MKHYRTNSPSVSFTFLEGKYLDLWTVVHISTGLLLASLGNMVPVSEPWPFFVAVILLILWELVEVRLGIGEHMENIITDILVGCLGYGLAIILFSHTNISAFVLGVVSVVVIVIFDFLGVRAYRRRTRS